MKTSGFISKVNLVKRYYDVLTTDNEFCILFFEELEGRRLQIGDILMFDVVDTTGFGMCAINIEKISNKILEDLTNKFEKGETFSAFVEKKIVGGFKVSYNGYQCFLPNLESKYKGYSFDGIDVMVNEYSDFKVLSIENENVLLSCWEFLRNKYIELREKEIEDIHIGKSFIGKVHSIFKYTVFVSYNYSDGFFSLKNILDNYSILYSIERRKLLDKTIERVFKKGKEMYVTVIEINNKSYKLDLDWNIEPNNAIYGEFITLLKEISKIKD
jgi:ribosomal protein S1